MTQFLSSLHPWLYALLVIAFAVLGGLAVHWVLFRFLRLFARHSLTILDDSIVRHLGQASRLLVVLVFLGTGLPFIPAGETGTAFIRTLFNISLIAAVARLLIKLTSVAQDVFMSKYNIASQDNLVARKVYTQIQFLRKVVILGIGIVALALILMTFDSVRQLGASILASAGVLGIIIGFAAQRSLATVMAGFQIALTQPIRIDDVVIVEGEWGRIEEITLTYVVVRIWDLRRLILPITYFIEKPFQNWTRVSADILGAVTFYVDYTVPVEILRKELQRILHTNPLWDRKVSGLQVTDATERAVELRALVSAADASKAWDLRCQVREQLISFVQREYPEALPRLRAAVVASPRNDEFLPGGTIDEKKQKNI